jgi:hypothetical protein
MNEPYDGPSRLTGEIATAKYAETAVLKLPATGQSVRGLVLQRHELGQVTIEWAGMRITGFPEPTA